MNGLAAAPGPGTALGVQSLAWVVVLIAQPLQCMGDMTEMGKTEACHLLQATEDTG